MQEDLLRKIESNPKYNELVKKRSRFGWMMAIIMLVIYYTFIMIIAFDPQFLATPLAAGSVITIGIPIGIGVIIAAFILTGIFVYRANTEFDRIVNELKRDVL